MYFSYLYFNYFTTLIMGEKYSRPSATSQSKGSNGINLSWRANSFRWGLASVSYLSFTC